MNTRTELRWCIINEDNTLNYLGATPTAPDALEYADKALDDNETLEASIRDARVKDFKHISIKG